MSATLALLVAAIVVAVVLRVLTAALRQREWAVLATSLASQVARSAHSRRRRRRRNPRVMQEP